jgi:hypothetical protein
VRLLELPCSFNIESVRRPLVYQILNFVDIPLSDPEFDPTK